MASLGDIHPAFKAPEGQGGCCNCLTSSTPECPSVWLQAKQCYGAFTRPGPCGIYRSSEDKWYLTLQRDWSYSVRAVDPPPHQYECEEWFLNGSLPRRVKSELVSSNVPYVSQQITNYTVDEEGNCEGPEVSTLEDTYETSQYVNTVYNIANTECTGGGTGEIPPPGGPVTELDPDSTDPIDTYSNEWTPMPSAEVMGLAEADHDANCDSGGEWFDGPYADRFVSIDGANEVAAASMTTAQTRFFIWGGNTGYFSFRWAVINELFEEVDSGTVIIEWDPTMPLERIVSGPGLDAEWPDYASGENVKSLQLVISDETCEPPTP
jgi:hypothetical protein